MLRRFLPPAIAAGVMLASFALAQAPEGQTGYLTPATTPSTLRIMPPPPPPASGRGADDRSIFEVTRALKGTPRWDLATRDADLRPGPTLFACALGVELDSANAPVLSRLFDRVAIDARGVIDPPKDHYDRPRPYLSRPDAATCIDKTDALTKSASYPSGHATLSWAWGLILAELAPDRATEIMMRARAIGESRIVCGVHYLSDVEEGRTNGSVLVAALHASPDFRADLEKAREEVRSDRETPHVGPEGCLDADQAAANPPY